MPHSYIGTRGKVDAELLGGLIIGESCDYAYLEEVHSMPGQGVASTFTFGEGYGIIKGALGAANIPLRLVRPQVWKRGLRIPPTSGQTKTQIKKAAMHRASTLMPDCVSFWKRAKDDGVAEAAMIALYGSMILGFTPTKPLKICPDFEVG